MTPIEEIKSHLDIVEVIKDYIPLKQAGTNWKANCPFHQEKSPSFMVSKDKQIWHCFGCHEGGDVISFVQKIEGLSFGETLGHLALKAGVTLSQMPQDYSSGDKDNLRKLNQLAQDVWQKQLWTDTAEAKKTLAYLKKRGLEDSTVKDWNLGLSANEWEGLSHLLLEKYSRSSVTTSGLVIEKEGKIFDRFRRRLMFPIADIQGTVVAFTARTLQGIAYDEEDIGGKYVNSPQTALYNKSSVLYGLHFAKQEIRRLDYVIVVEGNLDVIMSHQAGVKNVVAVSGTALTADQLRLLKRFTNNIVLAFDADQAGSQAIYKSGLVTAGQFDMNVKVLLLSGAKDPAEIVQHDPEEWKAILKETIPLADFYYQEILKRVHLSRADHKKIAANKILQIIVALGNSIEQDHYVQKLAADLQISVQLLWKQLESLQQQTPAPAAIEPTSDQSGRQDPFAIWTEALLALLARQSEYLPRIIDAVEPEHIHESYQPLYKQIIIHYTKEQSTDLQSLVTYLDSEQAHLWSSVVHRAELQYQSLSEKELEREFHNLHKRIRMRWLKERMHGITQSMESAELAGDQESLSRLTLEFNELSKQLSLLLS